MKIKSNGEVSAIRLTHKALSMNWQNILPKVEMYGVKFEHTNIAFIEFDDTGEIELMIRMLERFKGDCEAGIGRWVRAEQALAEMQKG